MEENKKYICLRCNLNCKNNKAHLRKHLLRKIPCNVTNLDYEHIDFYKNYQILENSFIKFIEKTPPTGNAIICIASKKI